MRLKTKAFRIYNQKICISLKPVIRALSTGAGMDIPTNSTPSSSTFSRTPEVEDKNTIPSVAGTSGVKRSKKRKQKNLRVNHPKKMQRFQQDQDHRHIIQYMDNGMRKIKPYIFQFETHAKGRWIGRTLMDVFKKEFRLETPEYYEKAIAGGLITLNGKPVTANTIIRSQDFLRSRVHRHEPPVSGEPLNIIAQTDDFIVINKPASIPIHPAGKYRHNSIVYLMAKEHGLKGLHTFYRLDRLTSGVFIFARSAERAKKIDSQMRARELLKVYLCKVKGEFPSRPLESSEPILAVSHKIGVCRVSSKGKPAKTAFQRVSFDGETSIIKCTPFTGRMHQIRVHLQYLGFPVLGDPLYTGPAWGADQGKAGKIPFATDEELVAELTRLHNKEQAELVAQQSTLQTEQREQGSSMESEGIVKLTHKTCVSKDEANMMTSPGKTEVPSVECPGETITSQESLNVVNGPNSLSDCSTRDTASTSLERTSRECGGDKQDGASSIQDYERSASADSLVQATERNAVENYSNQLIGDEQAGVGHGAERTCDQAEIAYTTCDSSSNTQGKDPESDPSVNIQEKSCYASDSSEVPSRNSQNTPISGQPSCEITSTPDLEEEVLNRLTRELCRECRQPLPDPEPENMMLYLHALTYKGPDFEFSTPLPIWAKEHMEKTGSNML